MRNKIPPPRKLIVIDTRLDFFSTHPEGPVTTREFIAGG